MLNDEVQIQLKNYFIQGFDEVIKEFRADLLSKEDFSKIINKSAFDNTFSLESFIAQLKNIANSEDILFGTKSGLLITDVKCYYFSLLESLESLTGKAIDLVSVNSLRNPVLKEEIEKSKIELYAA